MSPPTTLDLLQAYARSIDALRERGVIRTRNVVGCYAEHLFASAMEWTLERNAARGFDARDRDGQRYQIKARRITKANTSTQLGDLPPGDQHEFDAVAAVVFDEDFGVVRAALIPVSALAGLRTKHAKRPRLHLREAVLLTPDVIDVTTVLRATQAG